MDDITRERVWRKLMVLPDQQLYQVLDYIEFLEGKYARGKAPEPSGLQRFAERLQDRLRGRSVAPEYISGAVGMLGIARKVVETGRDVVSGVVQTGLGVVDEVVEAGRDLLSEPPAQPGAASLPEGVPPPAATALPGPAGGVGSTVPGPRPAAASSDPGPEAASPAPGAERPAPGPADSPASSPAEGGGLAAEAAGEAETPPLTPPVPPPGRDAMRERPSDERRATSTSDGDEHEHGGTSARDERE